MQNLPSKLFSLHKFHLIGPTNFANMSNICFIVRLFSVLLMEREFSKYSFPMKTDACKAEDRNILHIKECLLLSCVASFEDWSSSFRTRPFTL